MGLYPTQKTGKMKLQPGARGEYFKANLPGFRSEEDRVNRTNNHLGTSAHDVPNIKYDLDRRLPSLFRFGYAVGYNQIVVPKGRIMAIDPYMNQLDTDTHKALNVLTLANGGSTVKLRDDDKKQWEPVDGEYQESASGEKIYVSNSVTSPVTTSVDPKTGKIVVDGNITNEYRPANKPVGILQRNEYTRDDFAQNGMQPGAILTDAMVELPFFLDKTKAEENPWGSAYGNILPGDILKSDENGRFCVSPLSRADILAGLSAAQIELERQQVIGQVYEVSRDLLPAGAAKYAEWALSDRMNFEQFNPLMWRETNRHGEDLNENSPYRSNGGGAVNSATQAKPGEDPFNPTGYGVDNTLTEHDMHLLASTARRSDLRMGLEFQLEQGIPGLTDGYNAVTRPFGPENVGFLKKAASNVAYVPINFKTSELNIEKGTLEIAVTTKMKHELEDGDFTPVTAAGQVLNPYVNDASIGECLTVTYMEELQGFFQISVTDRTTFDTADLSNSQLYVYAKYNKRGLAGVPTFMDWDGCCGFISVLLQR